MTRRGAGGLIVLVTLATACVAPVEVATDRADRIDASGQSRQAPSPVPDDELVWSSCAQFDIPEFVGTTGWECSTLDAPMDPFDATASDDRVQLALTRHRATGDRQGALLINPGGPGGAGVEFAWGIRPAFPAGLLRSFDIVGWDPRGVGNSTPPIGCGTEPDLDDDSLMATCADVTGVLAAHLSAPYSAADMEAIRVGLGEDRLDYVGYSYGSTLGAAYAARYPDTVGRFVLDGVTDPEIGSEDGPFDSGFPYYADDGIPEASDRFNELCEATLRCPLGDSAATAIEGLIDDVDELSTDDFVGSPDVVESDVLIELMNSSFNYSGDWELLATALADALDGDASAIASLVSNDSSISSGALDQPADGLEIDNIVIYCADFRHVISEWSYCDGIPENAERLAPVEAAEVSTPILVIGTDFDPATPGKNARAFADALGDAVSISWAGVGHTAFPAPTRCIDDAVVDFLLDGVLPVDGLECPFLDQVGAAASDEELADILFGHGDAESERLLIDVFEFGFEVDADRARCAARHVNGLADRTISHVVLAVTSLEADQAIRDALDAC